jgi:beta-lactamase superfamily II metal-dependent hydrolase
LEEKGVTITFSDCYKSIESEDYFIAFLSPLATDGKSQSYYSEFNGLYEPSSQQINDLSPIIYFQCMGMRMLFTGDASSIQEKLVIQNYLTGFYDQVFGQGKVNLIGVDFLKLGHHGDENSSCQEFLEITLPKNAVASCGTSNPYGHPSSSTLDRLILVNPNVKLYRTDLSGNIIVTASKNNSYKVTTNQSY